MMLFHRQWHCFDLSGLFSEVGDQQGARDFELLDLERLRQPPLIHEWYGFAEYWQTIHYIGPSIGPTSVTV